MAVLTRQGYGQVEDNKISAIKGAKIYASLPLDDGVSTLQNGEFLFYSPADGKATAEPTIMTGEPLLVFNEYKNYRNTNRRKDFAMFRVANGNYVTDATSLENALGASYTPDNTVENYGYRLEGFAPRLIALNIGDIYTTNMLVAGVDYALKDFVTPVLNAATKTLRLEKVTDVATVDYALNIVKVYTMADGQQGYKLMRVK